MTRAPVTSSRQRFVKNKQTGKKPRRCGTFLASFLLFSFSFARPERGQTICSTFARPKCPVPPKPFPQMERITTTSSRRADPTSFLTGKTQCDKSAPTGKSAKRRVWFHVGFKAHKRGELRRRCCMFAPVLLHAVCGFVQRGHPLSACCRPAASCHVSSVRPRHRVANR